MKRFAAFFSIGAIILSYFATSCREDPHGIDKLPTICFEKEILPIFQTSCALSGCHSAGSDNEFIATNYTSIMRGVKPGNAKGSEVYKVLTRNYGDIMPPTRPLTIEQRQLIEVWIEQGAQNTTCDAIDTSSNNPPVKSDSVCFEQSILPILLSSCGKTGCHDASTHAEGYQLTSYATLMQRSGSIVPGNPGRSKIYKVMTATGEDVMPPNNPLPSQQIETFKKWIEQGALNSDCPSLSCDTTGTISFTSQVWPIIQNNCLGCHNSTGASGGVNFSGYQNVKAYADNLRNGTPVLAGVIKQMSGFSAMPPSGKLDDCQIRKVELWIEQGKLNN